VDFAVLECARGGILRAGLAFEQCDISIITNISEDHLGLDGVMTLEEMVEVKAVVAHSTAKHGYCILNADDDHVYNIRHDLECNIALFSTHEDNERVKRHCANGGMAAIIEKGYVTICKGNFKTRVEKIANIPLSFSGRSSSMIKNIVPAVLAGYLSGFSPEQLRSALSTFIPSPALTPGRMNIFNFRKFDVMLDYAHNSGGFEELKVFLERHPAPVKIGIVTGVGDRRDEDIRNVGIYAAQLFDEIIIRHDKDLRGRTKEEMTSLIMQGIGQVDPTIPVSVISDERDALRHAMDTAQDHALITTLTEDVPGSLAFLTEALKNETKEVPVNFPLSKAS
jgi:cyanophycin synthetase